MKSQGVEGGAAAQIESAVSLGDGQLNLSSVADPFYFVPKLSVY